MAYLLGRFLGLHFGLGFSLSISPLPSNLVWVDLVFHARASFPIIAQALLDKGIADMIPGASDRGASEDWIGR